VGLVNDYATINYEEHPKRGFSARRIIEC